MSLKWLPYTTSYHMCSISDLPKQPSNDRVLVGNSTCDDAAVFQIDEHNGVVIIVDKPYDFGAIACANALSDVYAMEEMACWAALEL